MDTILVPAAQYLRMSTDHQQYSLDNQSDVITRYAADHGFHVVKTYVDPAKSGLVLKNRPGLQKLIRDVVAGQSSFRVVLVYDVSRWGRFQDHDEAAHYEYLCKSSGVPVYYCAEMFGNENSTLGWLLKSLKRTMAGEYSRELSVKVKTGLIRMVKLGYKPGGSAPYGLRRQLLDRQDRPKQILEFGDRKSLMEEHVTFVPGPLEELRVIRRILREFVEGHRTVLEIADRLNGEGIPYLRGTTWKDGTIRAMLQNTRYIGMEVWGRTTKFLSTPTRYLPSSEWVVYPNALEAIVTRSLFVRAQAIMANYTVRLTNEQLLERLKMVLQVHGKLNTRIIDRSRLCPSITTYYKHFGGLLKIYSLIGYDASKEIVKVSHFRHGCFRRETFLKSVLETFPDQFQVVRKNKRFRPMVKYRRTGLIISFVFARYCPKRSKKNSTWLVETSKAKTNRAALVVLLDPLGDVIESLWLLRNLPPIHRHKRIRSGDEFLRAGVRLENLSHLVSAINSFRSKN